MGLLIERIERHDCETKGSVAYLYRPQTINPARMYLMIDWDQWKKAAIRPMGLVDQVPLVIRPMTTAEWEICRDVKWLTLRSFESWEQIFERERQHGVPEEFIEQLKHYQLNFKLKNDVAEFSRPQARFGRTR